MNIFITGATGFLGSHLTDLFDGNGHQVYSLIRNQQKAQDFSVKGKYIIGRLSLEKKLPWIESLPEYLDLIIHTAGIVHSKNEDEFEKINTLFTNNLHQQLKNKYKTLHFIFISSLAAGGPSSHLKSPRHTASLDSPVSFYGRSKLKAEKLLIKNTPKEWTLTILRPPMIIGPRDPALFEIFKMVKSRLIIGPGLNFIHKKYSFICVKDLILIIQEFASQKRSGVFYTSHHTAISFKELISTIENALGKKVLLKIPIPNIILKIIGELPSCFKIFNRITRDKVNELIQTEWVCDSSSTLKELNYNLRWNLKDTIHITLKDYQDRFW